MLRLDVDPIESVWSIWRACFGAMMKEDRIVRPHGCTGGSALVEDSLSECIVYTLYRRSGGPTRSLYMIDYGCRVGEPSSRCRSTFLVNKGKKPHLPGILDIPLLIHCQTSLELPLVLPI